MAPSNASAAVDATRNPVSSACITPLGMHLMLGFALGVAAAENLGELCNTESGRPCRWPCYRCHTSLQVLLPPQGRRKSSKDLKEGPFPSRSIDPNRRPRSRGARSGGERGKPSSTYFVHLSTCSKCPPLTEQCIPSTFPSACLIRTPDGPFIQPMSRSYRLRGG